MNKKKKIVLWIGISVIILMCLFPPTIQFSKSTKGVNIKPFYHYGFFFQVHDREIQVTKLLIQGFIVAVITLGLMTAFENKKVEKDEKVNQGTGIE